jgi:hypothetical protein
MVDLALDRGVLKDKYQHHVESQDAAQDQYVPERKTKSELLA